MISNPNNTTNDASEGGITQGPTHEEGGMPAVIISNAGEKRVEIRGGEVIINDRSMKSKDELACTGTPKQIASKLNEYKNGVQFEEGGGCKVVSKVDMITQSPPIQNFAPNSKMPFDIADYFRSDYAPSVLPMKKYTVTSTEDETIEFQADYEDLLDLIQSGESLTQAMERSGYRMIENEAGDDEGIETAANGKNTDRSYDPSKRPSPAVSATIFNPGFQMTGNDGNTWEIREDSRGVHRWVKVKYADGALVDVDTWVILTIPDGVQSSFENSKPYLQGESLKMFTTKEEAEAYGRDFGFNETFWAYRPISLRAVAEKGYKIQGGELVKQQSEPATESTVPKAARGWDASISQMDDSRKMQVELDRLRGDLRSEQITMNEYYQERDNVYRKYGILKAEHGLDTEIEVLTPVESKQAAFATMVQKIDAASTRLRDQSDYRIARTFIERLESAYPNYDDIQSQLATIWMQLAELRNKTFVNAVTAAINEYQQVATPTQPKPIPNNYAGKSGEEIWGGWNYLQKKHFLIDHTDIYKEKEIAAIAATSYSELMDKYPEVWNALAHHTTETQYGKGGDSTSPDVTKEIKAISGNWSPEQLHNIAEIARICKLKLFNEFSSGGGFEHIMLRMPDGHVAIFSNADDTISISSGTYQMDDSDKEHAYYDFWEKQEEIFASEPAVSIQDDFANTEEICEAIKTKNIRNAFDDSGAEEFENGGVAGQQESVADRFDLPEPKNTGEFFENIRTILSQYGSRRMGALQCFSYLQENPELGKQFLDEKGVKTRVEFDHFISNLQKKARAGKGNERMQFRRELHREQINSVLTQIESVAHDLSDSAKAEDGMDSTPGEHNKIIATEILNQLGGASRLVAMTGAYNFLAIDNGVSFRIKNPPANYIRVTLTSSDLYDVEIGRIRGVKYNHVNKATGIQASELKGFIEKATGMYLQLFEKGGEASATGKTTKYGTKEKREKFIRRRGNMITFKQPFYPGGTSGDSKTQIISGGIEKARKSASVKIIGQWGYDSPWYNSMDDLIDAIDWDWIERAHD